MSVAPLRRQYLQIKKQYPDVLVLFRLGDFYETFDDDAKIAASVLGIVLTGREMGKGQRVPMAGIPHHALDNYLGKLIDAGHKVAVCEQTSDSVESRGLVDREVVRVVTPGTVVEPNLLDAKANNYLVAVCVDGEEAGIAYVDITTSEFATTQLEAGGVALELGRLRPSELLLATGFEPFEEWRRGSVTDLDPRAFDTETARELLLRHFGVTTLEGYGCDHAPLAVGAAGAVLAYLADTQKGALAQITGLSTYSTQAYMTLDPQTRRNLELFEGGRWGGAESSLIRVLDLTKTAMGGRLLRRWLGQPLLDRAALGRRLDAVEWLVQHTISRERTMGLLGSISDLERLCNRVRSGLAMPRELVALRRSLELVPEVRRVLEEPGQGGAEKAVAALVGELKPCEDVVALIGSAISDDPPAVLGEGEVIRAGFSEELDTLKDASRNARGHLADLERKERERTGIRSLKVGYNRVFGYYIEVSKANAAQAPDDYIRKQTLVGGERYITPELKEYESLILNAQERTAELERSLFAQVCRQAAEAAPRIMATAGALAQTDVLAAFAEGAIRYRYVRPGVTDGDEISIVNGRHPVVERTLGSGAFVPNDTRLTGNEVQLVLLTGPNMAGKSTYLRQVGLIVLMAQTGCFVPADAATIGTVDRVFTRVGLQDDLAAGQSTFMVEMIETASILNNATARSLIILDEIGRGTSTYDGMSIARAVAEYIHNHPRLGTKTLFATHYHELTELAQYLPRVVNANVAVSETDGEVVFLHKIGPGGADRSYGVHVAQLAGLPRPVVARAHEILEGLEAGTSRPRNGRRRLPESPPPQLPLFGTPPAVIEELAKLDIASLTPLEAITKLFELQAKARGDGKG